MRIRYILFISITSGLSLFFFYYILAFCAIYPHTSIGWAISSLNVLLFKIGIAETAGPLFGGLLRKLDKDGGR